MPESAAEADWQRGCDWLGLDRRDYVPLDTGPLPRFEREVLQETDRHLTYRDGMGVVRRALKHGETRGTRASMDQFLQHPVADAEDFERMRGRYDPADPARYPQNWGALARHWRGRDHPLFLPENATFGLYSTLRTWMGVEGLSVAFYDDPALVERMVEFLADFFIELARPALRALDIDCLTIFEDMAFRSGPLLSPATFRRFFAGPYRRLARFAREMGVEAVWVDSDGDLEPLLPALLEAGVTCIWPCEAAAGMDPAGLRERWGDRLVMSGGVDKRALARGKQHIDRQVRRLRPVVEAGGYIPTVDHIVPPDVPYENFLYYLDAKKRLLGGL
jgi:uroporphyrinogen decarboxylase